MNFMESKKNAAKYISSADILIIYGTDQQAIAILQK